MTVLFKKLYRDLWQNKGQFISIFIMVLLGVMCFSGIHAYMDGMQESGDSYYAENNLQDLWIDGESFTKADLNKIKSLENVKDAERKCTFKANLDNYTDVTLEANFIESNNISKFFVVEGKPFSAESEGIWLDSYLADNLNINLGDELQLSYEDYTIKARVAGLINTPDHVYSVKDDTAIFPSHKDYGYCYMSLKSFPKQVIFNEIVKYVRENGAGELKKYGFSDLNSALNSLKSLDIGEYIFNDIMVDVDNSAQIKQTKAEIEKALDKTYVVTTRENQLSPSGYQREIEEGNTYSSLFTFLFLSIAVLSVVTTMYRFVRKERVQIGTLKSLGIKKSRIIAHYVSYGFCISLLASAFGLLAGKYIIGSFFMNMQMTYYEVPLAKSEMEPIVFYMAAATVVFITAVSYLSARKILKEKAAQAIRVEVPKVKHSKKDITSSRLFKNASVSTKWNIRDISRNKGRSITTVAGIMGCTIILVCAFGMLDSMNAYVDWEFGKINDYAYKIALSDDCSQKQLEKLIDKYGDKTSKTYAIEILNGSERKANILTVNNAEGLLNLTDHNKNAMRISNNEGVYITEKLSSTEGINTGDEIKWHIMGEKKWYKSKVVGLNRDPQSQSLTASKEYLKKIDLKYFPDSIYTNDDLSAVKTLDGAKQILSIDAVSKEMSSMLEMMYSMIVMFVVISAALGFVIIYNLGGLSFAEKHYQFATLKVLGYKNKQIKKIFVEQNIWLTIVAIVLALPLGYWMTDYIFKSAIGDTYDFTAVINVLSYVYSVAGTLIVAFFVNLFLAKRVKNIDMVSSLKGNE